MQLYHKLTYQFLRLFSKWLGLLSDRSRNRLAVRVASYVYNWIPLRKAAARSNIRQAFPERPPAWRESTLRQCYQFFVRLMLLFFTIPKKFRYLKVHVTGRQYLDDAFLPGRGAIMVAGHFGAWEVFAAWTGYNGYPVVPVAVRQKNRGANRFFTELRGDAGTVPIYRKESLANMYQVLADGKLLTLGSDQDARSRGVFVDFFGIQSSTPKGTALFHLKTGAPIVFGACYEQDGEYYLDFEPINVNKEDNVQSITQNYTTVLEKRIRQHPEQYFWWHKRWKTKPPVSK